MWNPKNQKSKSWGIEKNLPTWVGIDDEYMDSFIQKPSDLVPATFEEYCNTLPEIKAAMTTSSSNILLFVNAITRRSITYR